MRTDLYNFMNEMEKVFNYQRVIGFPIDVLEVEGGYQVIAEMPGITKDQIEISFEDGTLVIFAKAKENSFEGKYLINERKSCDLKRSISFGDVSEEAIKARFENGLLIINIILKKPEEKKKRIIEIE